MFIPKYLITNSILHDIGSIDVTKEVVMTAELIPAWLTKLKSQAIFESVFYGAILEGIRLTEEEVGFLVNDQIQPSDLNSQLVKNYSLVLDQVNQQNAQGRPAFLTIETLLEIHRLLTDQVDINGTSGQFRKTEIAIRNAQTGEISYSPPPAAEIPYLVEDLINWLNSKEAMEIHPVLRSAITHAEIYRIQPFAWGNEMTSRIISHLILVLSNYDLKGFFSLEQYFSETQLEYYLTLQTVCNQKVLDVHERDLTLWIEYFTRGVAWQMIRLKATVSKVAAESRQKDRLGKEVTLNERQIAIIEYLNKYGQMKNKDFRKIFPDFSDDTVLRELKFLKQKGLVKKEGNTKRAIYVLADS